MITVLFGPEGRLQLGEDFKEELANLLAVAGLYWCDLPNKCPDSKMSFSVYRQEHAKRLISLEVFRVVARSESISPTTEENLNP